MHQKVSYPALAEKASKLEQLESSQESLSKERLLDLVNGHHEWLSS